MVSILESSPVTLAIVVGIPVAAALLVLLAGRRETPAAAIAAGSVVAVAVVAVSVWAILRSAAPQAAPASAAAVPATPPPPAVPSQPIPTRPPSTPVPSPSISSTQPIASSSTPAPSGQPSGKACAPSATTLQETARGIAYQARCLAAPAGQPLTIDFTNDDAGTQHNMHIFSADPTANPGARSLFTGTIVTGPVTATYRVPGLSAGTYFFHCDVHPTLMMGTLVVGG